MKVLVSKILNKSERLKHRTGFKHLGSLRLAKVLNKSGTASLELAVLIPIILSVAVISINLLVFMGDCAKFDRISAEAVRVYGISPGYGEYGSDSCSKKIRLAIKEAFGGVDRIQIEVKNSDSKGEFSNGGNVGTFSFNPLHREYSCKMISKPWLLPDGLFGIRFSGPVHEKSFVVSPFKAGGLI
jgi:hypothetical protein